MAWPEKFRLWYHSYLKNLETLNQIALVMEYKQVFRSSPKTITGRRMRVAIAMKRSADSCRKYGMEVPSDVKVVLSILKER